MDVQVARGDKTKIRSTQLLYAQITRDITVSSRETSSVSIIARAPREAPARAHNPPFPPYIRISRKTLGPRLRSLARGEGGEVVLHAFFIQLIWPVNETFCGETRDSDETAVEQLFHSSNHRSFAATLIPCAWATIALVLSRR